MELVYRCKDDPEANGRIPQKGEQRYSLLFPLENGDDLRIHMGRESFNHFSDFLGQMYVDDDNDKAQEDSHEATEQ